MTSEVYCLQNGLLKNQSLITLEDRAFFIDPEDGECTETSKKREEKLEVPMEGAMPCKLKTTKSSYRHRENDSGYNKIQKSKHACIVQAHESFGTNSTKRS